MNSRWVPGNRFTLLENGEDYFPRVFGAIEGAEREVLIETFIWFDDQVGQALRDALIAAARRGVQTH
ncbi:MAG: cardiolipin synthase ClsB, partial [Betaproteobacteria bacterium HGW-Betaproteobacteria-16]